MIALVGKPNVGKSTLMNTLIGQKISIVSNKAQTTRHRVVGILSTEDYQAIFVDTPGLHKPHTRLGKVLNEVAQNSMDTDLVVVVCDVHRKPDEEDRAIAQMLIATGWLDELKREAEPNVLLCLNKMDILKAIDVASNVEAYCTLFGTEQYMLTSLVRVDNVEKLMAMIVDRLPEGPPLYPEDEVTDQPMRRLAAEILREQVLNTTRQEIPHAVATLIEEWTEEETRTYIAANIVVEKDSQKGILIGKGGAKLREMGTAARLAIEELTGRPVYLELYVKVEPNWRQSVRLLRDFDIYHA